MVTREDLESFLIRMDIDYEEVDEGMYLLRSRNGGPPIVAHHSPPLLLLRMKVMDLDEKDTETSAELYRLLLEMNATDVVHGAYGIENGELILSDTLELETLDFHEVQASIESIQLALSGHMQQIRDLTGRPVSRAGETPSAAGTAGAGAASVPGVGGSRSGGEEEG